jgi:hypothetical protein
MMQWYGYAAYGMCRNCLAQRRNARSPGTQRLCLGMFLPKKCDTLCFPILEHELPYIWSIVKTNDSGGHA